MCTYSQETRGRRKLVVTELDLDHKIISLQNMFRCSIKIDFIDIVSANRVYLDWHVVSKNITNIQLFYPEHIHK